MNSLRHAYKQKKTSELEAIALCQAELLVIEARVIAIISSRRNNTLPIHRADSSMVASSSMGSKRFRDRVAEVGVEVCLASC